MSLRSQRFDISEVQNIRVINLHKAEEKKKGKKEKKKKGE